MAEVSKLYSPVDMYLFQISERLLLLIANRFRLAIFYQDTLMSRDASLCTLASPYWKYNSGRFVYSKFWKNVSYKFIVLSRQEDIMEFAARGPY